LHRFSRIGLAGRPIAVFPGQKQPFWAIIEDTFPGALGTP
jgi:hypothetical protein